MKKNKLSVLTWAGAGMLALLLLTAGVLPVVAEDTPQNKAPSKQGLPAEKQTRKEKTSKTPDTFVPTDKVSADRAVAFPTDI